MFTVSPRTTHLLLLLLLLLPFFPPSFQRVAKRHACFNRPHRIFRMVDWSQLCTQQSNRPLWQLQQANYGGCIFAVSVFSCHARTLYI